MSTGSLQDFEAGKAPEAALMAALINALRGLPAQQGALTATHRSGRSMRVFTPSGIAIARSDDKDKPTATASEILWQLGPHVNVIPAAAVSGMEDAVQAAGDSAGVTMQAIASWTENSALPDDEVPDSWTLEATAATCSAKAMIESDPEAEVVPPPEGKIILGAILPTRGPRGQKQRILQMWPMPQHPCTIATSGYTVASAGEYYLLPNSTCQQVLADGYAPYYYATASPKQYYAQLLGRLDRFGRLACDTSLFYAGQRIR